MDSKTPVTILQELLLKKKINPTYNLILNGGGTHEPIFKYEVAAADQTAIGTGKSKKEAKHNAANELLRIMKATDSAIHSLSDDVTSPYEGVLKENAVGELQDFCCTHRLRFPEYKLTRDEGLPHAKVFSWSCTISSFTTEATARTKKNAKQMAAQEMLLRLKDCLSDIIETEEALQTRSSPSKDVEMNEAVDLAIQKISDHIKTVNASEKLGVNISDVCFSMKDENLPDLPFLDSLKDRESSWFDTRDEDDIKDIFSKIAEEIPCDYKLNTVDSSDVSKVAVVLIVNSSPSWTFIAVGSSLHDAVKNVFTEAVKFMVKMRL
uniref:Interferon-inducible double stranded RNA-dependent protein kinase activator A A n=1 Tax=Lygus hesperus TaxID=30085 RepID=A0A0A9ZIW5_LYGHE